MHPPETDPAAAPSRVWLPAIVALVAGGLGMAAWIWWCWPLVVDDAFISLRYSQRLLAGEGLNWNPGDNVEGYSNFLWVIGAAALAWLGIDWIDTLRVMGIGCSLLAIGGVWAAARCVVGPWPAVAAAAVFGAMAPVGIWAIAGLETPMVAAWWALAAALQIRGLQRYPEAGAERSVWYGSVFLALLVLTRPDGPLVVVAAALAAVFTASRVDAPGRMRRVLRLGLAAALVPFLTFLAHTLFRWLYHGALVPNTARIKGHLTSHTVAAGWEWLMQAFLAWAPAVACGLLGILLLLRRPGTRPAAVWLGASALLYAGYLMVVGGDVFPAYRLVAPVLVSLCIAVAAVPTILGTPKRVWTARGLGTAAPLTLLVIAATALLSAGDPKTRVALEERFQYDALALGEVLHRAHPEGRPLLAIDAAGALPFAYQGRCLDMIGLNDREIAGTEPLPFYPPTEKYIPGHLSGNGAIVMERSPDLMVFGPLPGSMVPIFRSSVEFEDDPRFQLGYRCVHYRVPPIVGAPINREFPREDGLIQGAIWVRLYGRAGIREEAVGRDVRIDVPGYLFASLQMPRPFRWYDPPAEGTPERKAWQRDRNKLEEWFYLSPIRAVVPPAGVVGGGMWTEVVPTDPERLAAGTPNYAGFPIPLNDLRLLPGVWEVSVEPAAAGRFFQVALHDAPADAKAWPPRPGAPLPPAGPGRFLLVPVHPDEPETRRICQLVLQRLDRETLDQPRRFHRVVLRRIDG